MTSSSPDPAAPPAGTTRRRAVTLERLLDAALETFADVGYQAASIEEICARAGYTRGAFYSSFRSKDELMLALHLREVGRVLEGVEHWLQGIEDEPDPIAGMVERYLGSFTVDRAWHLLHAEFTLHAMRDPAAAAALVAHTDHLLAELATLIERTLAATGRSLTADPRDVARVLVEVHQGSVDHALLRDDLPDSVRLERWFLPLLLRAVSAPRAPDPTS